LTPGIRGSVRTRFADIKVMDIYEVRPPKDKRGVDLISNALPFSRLGCGESDAVTNAIAYASIAAFRTRQSRN